MKQWAEMKCQNTVLILDHEQLFLINLKQVRYIHFWLPLFPGLNNAVFKGKRLIEELTVTKLMTIASTIAILLDDNHGTVYFFAAFRSLLVDHQCHQKPSGFVCLFCALSSYAFSLQLFKSTNSFSRETCFISLIGTGVTLTGGSVAKWLGRLT